VRWRNTAVPLSYAYRIWAIAISKYIKTKLPSTVKAISNVEGIRDGIALWRD